MYLCNSRVTLIKDNQKTLQNPALLKIKVNVKEQICVSDSTDWSSISYTSRLIQFKILPRSLSSIHDNHDI